jgi:hypothetical protein
MRVLNREQGTIITDLRFRANHARRDHAILHTDDSRIVLYIDTLYSPGLGRDMLTIAARAVGNRPAGSDDLPRWAKGEHPPVRREL